MSPKKSSSRPPRSNPRRSGTARESILEAAIVEFAKRGYEGVRLEHVARRAGCNRALIYRYFGDRENLFHAALKLQFARRSRLLDHAPEDFGKILSWWTSVTLRDPTFIRIILRESLDYAGGKPIESEARSDYYRRQLDMLEELRARGLVDESFDAELLFLALLSVVVLPAVMPQVVRLVTGQGAESEAFLERWDRFLDQLAESLGPRQGASEPRERKR
jgi:AcrR family transcriptional regulator